MAETVSIQDGTDQNQANVPFGNGRPGVSRELNSAMLMCVCVCKGIARGYISCRTCVCICSYVPTETQRERETTMIYIYIYIYYM